MQTPESFDSESTRSLTLSDMTLLSQREIRIDVSALRLNGRDIYNWEKNVASPMADPCWLKVCFWDLIHFVVDTCDFGRSICGFKPSSTCGKFDCLGGIVSY